jgi:carboxyl-terminal processing protease
VRREGDRVTARLTAAALGDVAVDGKVVAGGLEGDLRVGTAAWGTFRATRRTTSPPAPEPKKVADAVVAATRARWYDPRMLEREAWTSFLGDLAKAGTAAKDDLELAFAFYAMRQPLRVSHYALVRAPAASSGRAPASVPIAVEGIEGRIAYLGVRSFAGTPEEVDEAFATVDRAKPKALLVDLRGNAGGNLSAGAVAGHLLAEPTPAGTFLAAAWWHAHAAPPTAAEAAAMPPFDRFDVEAFRARLAKDGVVPVRIPALAPRFAGPVAVLVDHRTASACEPLVHVLRLSKRARVFGERTAGAMLSSESVDVGDGWTLTVPTADYVGPDGTRLEGLGVEPDVEVEPDTAEKAAIEWLRGEK